MRTIGDLAELTALVEQGGPRGDLYVRWSMGPDADVRANGTQASRDALTGVELPGLSANSLRPEPWWGDRSLMAWVARKLYDYHDMRRLRGRPGHVGGLRLRRHADRLDGCRLLR